MSYYDQNILSNPEAFGLRLLDAVDIAGSWEFDIFAIWTDGKNLFWGTDSGCSCPIPFDFTDIDDLHQGTAKECREAINVWGTSSYYGESVVGARMNLLSALSDFKHKGI